MAPAFVSGSRRLLAPIFALLVALRLFGWAAPAIAGAITIQYQITGATQDGLPLSNPGGTYMVRVAAT